LTVYWGIIVAAGIHKIKIRPQGRKKKYADRAATFLVTAKTKGLSF